MKTKNEYREYLAKMFTEALEQEGLEWRKGWNGTEVPRSAITQAPYQGINKFILKMESLANGYSDPRWCTFKQIQDSGWKLQRGAKGVQIEYWVPLHPETSKPITWDAVHTLKEQQPNVQIKAIPQYYYVFNGDKIEGIPEREKQQKKDIKLEDIVPKIAKNMKVEIINDTANEAFYHKGEDKIHLPKPEQFHSNYSYYATAMHELSHATGAEGRLNRDLSGMFGTPSYAFEELVAEMSAAFMSEHLPYELPSEQLENHKAYLSSWLEKINKNPDYLVQAIKKADECASYLEEKGELKREITLQKEEVKQLQLDNHWVIELASKGTNSLSGEKMQFLENCSKILEEGKLEQVRQGLQLDNLSIEQVSLFAKPELTPEAMDLYRYGMAHNIEPDFITPVVESLEKDGWSNARTKVENLVNYTFSSTDFKQIDRAKGELHIFQNKEAPHKNYIGQKVEQNGVKRILRLSDSMSLPEAHLQLKNTIQGQEERPEPKRAIQMERG